jgi:lipopolysaccharide transport system permease protein
MPSSGVPYPLFALCGLVPWQLFAFGLTSAANSLVGNERLLTKVYFPRVILPAAALLAGVLDFFVALLLLLGLMAWYGRGPGLALVAFPFFLVLTLAAALSVGLGLSALSVRYRDVRHALPFLTQFWMFATPIAYPSSLFPEPWRTLLGLNPMAGVAEGFRWALLGTERPLGGLLALSTLTVLGGLAVATAFFVRTERTMADEI